MSALVLLLSALQLSAVQAAEPPRDALLDAMVDELQRVPQLVLPDAKPAYYVLYRLRDLQRVQVQATLGGLVQLDVSPTRSVAVAVRVGAPELDNSRFESTFNWGRGFGATDLVLGDDVPALRHDLWLQTDEDYKNAVQNLARKQATRKGQTSPDTTPSFSAAPAVVDALPAAAPVDSAALVALARSLSARFLDHPQIESSRVVVGAASGRTLLVDTAGTRLQVPQAELDLRVIATARAEDGRSVTDHASYVIRSPADLPSVQELQADTDALAARLERWRAAPAATEPYVGPVIFEGDAAVDLFRYLLAPGLSGTPPVEQPRGQDDGPGAYALKRHALPAGYRVVDDAGADPHLASWYAYDDEGVAPQRVELIDDGVVRALLASRTPSKDAPVSTGHGRNLGGEEATAIASNLVVRPPKELSEKKLYALALKAAASVDLDYVLVVRRLADPTVEQRSFGFFFFIFGGGSASDPLPAPIEVVRRYADGHEEPVRGLVWKGVDRRLLRDIVAAGASTQSTFLMADPNPWSDASAGLPVTIRAPSVLVGEVELAPDSSPAPRPPRLGNPLGG